MKMLMIDLETLGTGEDAVVMEVGYAVFSNECVIENKSIWIPLRKQGNRKLDKEVMFWHQSNNTQYLVDYGFKNLVDPLLEYDAAKGLNELYSLIESCYTIWCKGSSFDFPILNSLFKTYNLPEMDGAFRKERCYRTFEDIYGKSEVVNTHSGREDAFIQASHMIEIHKKIKHKEIDTGNLGDLD